MCSVVRLFTMEFKRRKEWVIIPALYFGIYILFFSPLDLTGTLLLIRFERAIKTQALAEETLKDLIPGTFEGKY